VTEAEISNALCGRIVDNLPDHRVIWENRDSIPARPYIVLEIVRLPPRDRTVEGTRRERRGYLQATVVSELDEFAGPGLAIAAEIEVLFPKGQIAVSGEAITILNPPHIGQGYRDGPDWRTPVRIDYEV
jgi:hypothetical protein